MPHNRDAQRGRSERSGKPLNQAPGPLEQLLGAIGKHRAPVLIDDLEVQALLGLLEHDVLGNLGDLRHVLQRLTQRRGCESEFALASASLRQALQDMPEITEISKHIMFEETKQGLNLEIVDQDGRSMFADGAKQPLERTKRLIQRLAGPLRSTPLRVAIVGHTSAGFVPTRTNYDAFDLSSDRANAVRQILEQEGLPTSHVFSVSGKADTQPLFPDDPTLAANRRVTITLMREDPPLPPNLKP